MAQSLTKRSLFRPLPTTFLVGLTVVVAASCVADNDEPLATADFGAATATQPEVVSAAAPADAPELAVARELRRAFPTHADRVLGKLDARGFVAANGWFARTNNDSIIRHLNVQLPQDPNDVIKLTAPSGHEIRVRQLGLEGQAEQSDRAVVYRRAGGTSFWTVAAGGAEEWLHFEAGTISSDLDVAAEWEIEGATPVLMNGAVALMDDEGVAQAWVTAPEAYGANNRHVDLRLSVEGQRIELFADAQGEEVLLDPGWVAVAPVTGGYWGATATTLPNGNVLYANGFNGTTIPTATQIYNPGTNVWSVGGNMAGGRYAPAAVLMGNGRVLVMGGQTLSGYTNTAEIYNPATNTWAPAANMAVGRGLPQGIALANGNVLVAGGYDGTNFVTSAQIYNPGTNAWTAAGTLVTPRAWGHMARLADGRVVLAGGINTNIMTPSYPAGVEIYNPMTNTWASAGSLAVPRYLSTIATLSTGRVVLVGGIDATGVGITSVELFDPMTNTWSAGTPLPTAMGAQGGALLGTGRFVSATGFGSAAINTQSATYVPASNSWQASGSVTVGRYLPATVTLTGGDALMISGTPDGSTPTNAVDRYDATLLAAGAACTSSAFCLSGNCVDGVCCTVSACTASDSCHNPGTCQPGTGVCSNPNKPDGTVCNDGNACTQTDTCQAGACSGANPVVCTASDQCHNAGTCNTATGMCSNPNKADNTVCNDGNLCTQTDSCQAGVCTGANPVVCTAQDQCHDVGTCNSATGMCSNPNKADNTVCNDGNACTQTDTCQAGACTGANPVTCTAMDQCHDVGTCNSATGMCSNPNKADGTMCNDTNACTQMDTCVAGACTGAMPVVCTAMDQCHDVGTCNTMTGMCSNPAKADGASCNDGDACTQTDTCTAGACGGSNPVVCAAMDQCHEPGTCDSATGMCSNPSKPDGDACDDGDLCTQTDACMAGTCAGANPVTCMATDQCHDAGMCDPATGMCSDPAKADGEACDDGNGCTEADTCAAGVCGAGKPVTCTAMDECHEAGTCSTTTGMCDNPAKPDGTACTGGTCQAGTCKLDGAGGAGGGGVGGGGGAGGGDPNDGGESCSCRVVGSESSTTTSALAGLAFAAMTALRRRRSARK